MSAKMDPALVKVILDKLDRMIGLIEKNVQRLYHRSEFRDPKGQDK
jgi:hypothetical protein